MSSLSGRQIPGRPPTRKGSTGKMFSLVPSDTSVSGCLTPDMAMSGRSGSLEPDPLKEDLVTGSDIPDTGVGL